MEGLLLKDFYMVIKYYRSYLLIAVLFAAVSFVNASNLFFVFYPCLIGGMIPVNLLAYDESSRWLLYSGTLPVTRRQFVSAKYLIGLGAQLAMMVLISAAQIARMLREGSFYPGEFLVMLMVIIILSTISSSISLPFMFRWGVERGRTAYFVMIGMICAGGVIGAKLMPTLQTAEAQVNGVLIGLCMGGIVLYAASWMLSIRFFEKRELG